MKWFYTTIKKKKILTLESTLVELFMELDTPEKQTPVDKCIGIWALHSRAHFPLYLIHDTEYFAELNN